MSKLVTRIEWLKLNPYSQGYVFYMQAELPGSELKGQACPHVAGTPEAGQFHNGEFAATLDAQDGED